VNTKPFGILLISSSTILKAKRLAIPLQEVSKEVVGISVLMTRSFSDAVSWESRIRDAGTHFHEFANQCDSRRELYLERMDCLKCWEGSERINVQTTELIVRFAHATCNNLITQIRFEIRRGNHYANIMYNGTQNGSLRRQLNCVPLTRPRRPNHRFCAGQLPIEVL
jgi:hypothetical protein